MTSAAYKAQTQNRCPVLGGYDQKNAEVNNVTISPLHTGRTREYDDVIIGNIAAYAEDRNNTVYLYYPYNGTEHHTTKFEVLMYSDLPLALYDLPQEAYAVTVV